MTISDEKYMAFTTFRRSGEAVSTPTWVVPVSDGRVGFWTAMGSGKTKRLKNDPRVTLQASDVRGRPKEGFPVVTGTAELVQSGRLFDEVHAKIREKYGVMTKISKVLGALPMRRKKLTYADTVVLVRLDAG
jgi:PPOX class probable F420-dependent enzyme